ncbi:hypothetical protein TNCV_2251431 [Trichonephila clavipes]|nr:hypothetical protein TNCV_2251431 [Trichonephila clavipes]
MPSPVQSNCDAHDTIANGQYGAVWSMGHTQQDDISVFCRHRTSNTTSPVPSTTHSSSFKMTSTAVKQRCDRCRTPWQHLYFSPFFDLSNNSATHKIIYVMSGRHAKNFKFVY